MAREAKRLEPFYVEDSDGLEIGECRRHSSFSLAQCSLLVNAIPDGFTGSERKELTAAGIHPAFLQELAGDDGLKALRNHARWLADHVPFRLVTMATTHGDYKRKQCLEALEKMPPSILKEAAPALLETVESNHGLSEEAFSLLEKSEYPGLLDRLKKMDEKGLDETVQRKRLNLMAKLGDVETIDHLLEIVRNRQNFPHDDINWAIKTLGQLREKRAAPFLRKILEEESNEMSSLAYHAAIALCEIKDPESVGILIKYASPNTPDSGMRGTIIRALGEMESPLIIPFLAEGAKACDSSLAYDTSCRAAINALGDIGNSEAATVLLELISETVSGFDGVKSLIIINLGKCHDPSVIRPLRALAERMEQEIDLAKLQDSDKSYFGSRVKTLQSNIDMIDETIAHLADLNPGYDFQNGE